MKNLKKVIVSVGISFGLMLGLNTPAYSYDQVACGTWLCLPAGFAGGEGAGSLGGVTCSDVKSRFSKMLRKGKNPLPSWSSCKAPEAPEAEQPYTIDWGYYIYENFGNQVIKRRSGVYFSGRGNIEYSGGRILETTSTCRRTTITQIGVYAAGWSVSNTFNDYVYWEWNTGLPLEEVRKPFTRKVVRTINHGNGQCR